MAGFPKHASVCALAFTACLSSTLVAAQANEQVSSPQSSSAAAKGETTNTLYAVATAHLDTQWNWTIQDTITKHIPSTLRGNFELFEKFPDYVFSFEGAFRYALAREYYPKEYARLKEYVKQGRWRVCGSSWDAGDVNVPSAESIMRHVLYGNGFFRQEFGKTSLDIFLPDCFGFGYALPSIAAHCGLKQFSTQKLTWGASIPPPFEVGMWEGPDGSSIVAGLVKEAYVAKIREDMSSSTSWLKRLTDHLNSSGVPKGYTYFGTGDIGGAPDAESVDWVSKSTKGQGPVHVVNTGADQLARDLTDQERQKLPHYKGELLLKTHGVGSYSSQAAMKRFNRKNELLADSAERASVAAAWLGGISYPLEKISDAWKLFLWHQFHDDIPGTSLPTAYLFSWNDEAIAQNKFAQVVNDAVGAMARILDTRVQGTPVVVYNPLSVERQDVVEARLKLEGNAPEDVAVFDGEGKQVPAQVLSSGGGVVRVGFVADMPPVGWKVYDVRTSMTPVASADSALSATVSSLENERYKLRIDENGDVASIYDKSLQKELLREPIRLALFDDESIVWPAWEILYKDVAAKPRGFVAGPAKVRVAEQGPARVAVEVERQADGSTFVQRIRLASGKAADRVEFDTYVDWKTTQTLVKAVFALNASNEKATYDLGLGTIQRGNDREDLYEVPAQQWADLDDASGSYGVAVMNDCKYGWDKPDNSTLRLTLLHTPKTGGNYPYQNRQDIGRHKMLFVLTSHQGPWNADAQAVSWSAARLNQPLLAFQATDHEGAKGKEFSLLKTSSAQVAVRALKKAEVSDEIVVRLLEVCGKPAENVSISLADGIESAREVTGAEEPVGEATVKDGKLVASFTPYQPKTFAVKVAKSASTMTLPSSTPVELPYNVAAVSADGKGASEGFDGKGHTIPAELFPVSIKAEGIEFKLGPAEGKNALVCQGQEIALTPGKANRLYILATAVGEDAKTAFLIDGKPYQLDIPEASERIAQFDTLVNDGKFTADIKRLQPAYRKDAPVAWTATHRHDAKGENEPYIFCNLFKYRIDLPEGARTLMLPRDERVLIFAASLATNPNDDVRPAWERDEEMFAFPRITPNGGPFLGKQQQVAFSAGTPGVEFRYTLDGSEPTMTSKLYEGPFSIDRATTVSVRAFVPGSQRKYVTRAYFTKAQLRKPEH